ncbi:MAG: hypothetical protein EBV90_03355 [Candidatus Fonsibacter ubiquis]|nr:hypothetical protein [Candidatus Fonsibacter ubiquis]
MVAFFRKLQLVFASVILVATSIAFILEIAHMVEIRDVNLPDLLLLFIYLEVIGMVTSYWRTQLAIAIVILKFRRSKLLGIRFDKDEL